MVMQLDKQSARNPHDTAACFKKLASALKTKKINQTMGYKI